MSRSRRVRDDLVDVFVDVIRSSARPEPLDPEAAQTLAEREARRAQEREVAARRREQRRVRSYASVGSGLLAGGVASMFLPAVAAVGVGFLAGGAASLLAGAVLTMDWSRVAQILRPSLPTQQQQPAALDPPEVNGRDLPRSQRDLVQGILDEVATQLRRLDKSRQSLSTSDPAAADACLRLIDAGGKLSDAVADAPGKLSCAQRAFTYFLPEAARLSEQMVFFAAQKDEKNLVEARNILVRTELVLEKAMLAVHGVDAAEANVGMRLVKQALDEELNGWKAPQ